MRPDGRPNESSDEGIPMAKTKRQKTVMCGEDSHDYDFRIRLTRRQAASLARDLTAELEGGGPQHVDLFGASKRAEAYPTIVAASFCDENEIEGTCVAY
jgi:hypothetical protein